jgi:hypothetical protein
MPSAAALQERFHRENSDTFVCQQLAVLSLLQLLLF